MKNIIVVLSVLLFTATTASAQEWHTDFIKAKEIAKKESKPIVLVFQGSDWCAPCIKLDREIWSTDTFKNYAKEHYVMLQADFPKRKKNALSPELTMSNAELAEAYNRNGFFPFVVVINGEGTVLGETSYKKATPQVYIDEINKFIN